MGRLKPRDGTVRRRRACCGGVCAFVCSVVHVDEQGFPFVGECFVVDGEAVVLRCYEATLASGEPPGWLWLRWPYLSLYVRAPAALASNWFPMQIPQIGFVAFEGFADVADGGFGEVGLPGRY